MQILYKKGNLKGGFWGGFARIAVFVRIFDCCTDWRGVFFLRIAAFSVAAFVSGLIFANLSLCKSRYLTNFCFACLYFA